ncbi:MAG: SpaA isopeptide-forming pilin-related protein [Eubacterium ventriosum]
MLPEVNSWDLEFKWNSQTDKFVYDISGNTNEGVLKVKNELPQTYISIVKKDSKSEKAVPGTTFGFYSKDNIYDKNGNIIVKAGEKIATVTTDENGIAKVPFFVPLMSEGYRKTNVEGETPTAGASNVTEETTVTDENVEKQTEAVTGEARKEKAEGETTTETVTGEDETETKMKKFWMM